MSFINTLQFVRKEQENDDVYTFYFSVPKGVKYKAGQHGLFILPGLYIPHPFSLSSSPDELYVMMTTHVGTGSRYKKRLMNMKAGDSMVFMGPILNFTFKGAATSYVFLAQGVGITPFRSMLVYAQDKSLPITTTLIHVDSKTHTFKNTTQKAATNAYYSTDSQKFSELVKSQNTDQLFYISGSPRFVSATRKTLSQQGVKARAIKVDSFLGY